jgi:acyl-coenzyme A thioesterase PaaI-like protein
LTAGKTIPRPWQPREPGRLVGRGHPAGDFLEAYEWQILEQRSGYLMLDVHLPEQTKNPRGQLFGGFTPTYVDFVALHTTRAGGDPDEPWTSWLATTNMRVDYFEPVVGPRFRIQSELMKQRGRTCFVETRFLDHDADELLVLALTTMRRVALSRPLGDA